MQRRYRCTFGGFAILAFVIAANARAQNMPPAQPLPPLPQGVLYKGVVGSVLELLPLEDDVKVSLQRTNAVVSGPMTARSIALLLGVASPVLMVPGLIWGIWAALNIEERKPDTARWLGTWRGQTRLGFCARDRAAHCTLAVPEPREKVTVTEVARISEPQTPQVETPELTPETEASLTVAEQSAERLLSAESQPEPAAQLTFSEQDPEPQLPARPLTLADQQAALK